MIFFIFHSLKKVLLIILNNISQVINTPNILKKLNFYRQYFNIKYKKNNIILFDNFEIIEHFEKRAFLFKQLQKFYNSNLYYFGKKRSLLLQLFYYLINAQYIKYNFSYNQYKKINKIFLKTQKKIKSKKDLFNLRLNNINIGVDIYESYLRDYSQPTLNITDKNFLDLLKHSIKILIFWESYIYKNNLKAIIISHRNYVHTNILCRIAYRKKIPVYTFDGGATKISKYLNDSLNDNKFYHNYFNELKNEHKRKAINISKKQLKKRFNGIIGVNMNYSKKSAFTKNKIKKKLIINPNKTNLLICTHCFYDNPHAYGGNLFYDFYEWIEFLGKISFKTNYDWYVKPHPDYLPGTIEIIKKLMKKFNNIKLIDPETSFHQLKNEGIDFVLTTYGSVAHELPLMDVQVINADKNNPNNSFLYSYTPKNLFDYKKKLLNLNNLPNMKKYKNDIYKFYYIHHYFKNGKKLFKTNSNNNFLIDDYFHNISVARQKIENKIYNFLKNDNKYLLDNKKLQIINKYEKS